jgi:hypothetical protein
MSCNQVTDGICFLNRKLLYEIMKKTLAGNLDMLSANLQFFAQKKREKKLAKKYIYVNDHKNKNLSSITLRHKLLLYILQ